MRTTAFAIAFLIPAARGFWRLVLEPTVAGKRFLGRSNKARAAVAAQQSKGQKETVGRVMHEFKHGELKTAGGRKVKNPKQAIAIGLHEAGASKYESKEKNRENLKRTKSRERHGATAKDASEPSGGR
jgi:Family of unknown function (DUF6496)